MENNQKYKNLNLKQYFFINNFCFARLRVPIINGCNPKI